MKCLRIIQIVSVSILLCAALLSASRCYAFRCGMRAKGKRTVTLSAPFASGSTFVAQTHNGSITARGGEAECTVVATIETRAWTQKDAQDLADRTEVTLVRTDDALTAKIKRPKAMGKNRSISVSYDIRLPNRSNLSLESLNGPIRLSSITGLIEASTHNGEIVAESVDGTIKLRTLNGRIGGAHISGDINANTLNGAIEITYAKSAPVICTIAAVTHNGRIHLVPPSGVSAKVVAVTHNGTIRTDLPIKVVGKVNKKRLSGTIGSGDGSINLETYNGAIEIMQ